MKNVNLCELFSVLNSERVFLCATSRALFQTGNSGFVVCVKLISFSQTAVRSVDISKKGPEGKRARGYMSRYAVFLPFISLLKGELKGNFK